MDKYSNGNVSMTLIFDERRDKQGGKYPVRFRVLFDRKAFYITPGYDFTPDEFNNLENSRKLKDKREAIDRQWDIVKKKIEAILKSGAYSHDKLKVQIKGKNLTNVCTAIDNMVSVFDENQQAGNAKIYRTTKQFVCKFLGEKVTFKNITPKVLQDLQNRALSEISQSTVSIYFRTLRSVFNSAIVEGTINENNYPFARNEKDKTRFHIKQGSGTHIALNVSQMAAIEEMEIYHDTPALKRSRDLFLLMFYMGGINIGDLLRLKWRNYNGSEIIYMRQKTKRTNKNDKPINVPVTKTVKMYLYMYGTENCFPDNYILPYLKNPKDEAETRKQIESFTKNMNDDLNKISKILGFPRFSTMVSRHSFATISKDNEVSESFIKEQLGHSSIKTTQNYLKNFESGKRKEVFENLENLIKK